MFVAAAVLLFVYPLISGWRRKRRKAAAAGATEWQG